jgi:hypothetical protein
LYVVQGGEVGTPESIDPAVPAVANSPLASCEAVRTQFREQRYSVVGLFDTANPASSIKRWEREGCGAEFQQRVGYRFRLIESTTPTTAVPSSSVKLSVTMANDGYARPFNPRQVELVMRNNATGEATRLPVPTPVDTRLWLPGPGETQTLSLAVGIPAGIAAGNYDLLLNLPDPEPALNTRPEFSMRLANTNVWESTSGYNNLRTSVNISTSSQSPQTTAPQPAQKDVKVMAVGDSLTEGNGPVPGTFQSYRGHLYNSLVAASYQIDTVGPNRWFTLASAADGEYAGNAGFTIGPDRSGVCTRPVAGAFEGCPSPHYNIYENIDGWIALYKPDVITLMIGANDQFPETLAPGATGVFCDVDKSEGAAKLEALVSKIRQAAPDAQLVWGGSLRESSARPSWLEAASLAVAW